jgi:glycosyltransferase involved in cell wall biosynthesis
MSSGLPVIVSDKPFFRQSLSSEFAIFVNSESIDELGEAIVTLILDKRRRRKMGHLARTYASKLYSFGSYTQKLVSIYQGAIAEKSSPPED